MNFLHVAEEEGLAEIGNNCLGALHGKQGAGHWMPLTPSDDNPLCDRVKGNAGKP